MAKAKHARIKLESRIQRMLLNDNGVTSHFDYRVHMNSSKNTIELNLLTYNPMHKEYMLLNRVKGQSSIDCLEKMLIYLENSSSSQVDYSFTIEWKQKDSEEDMHISYFRGKTELEVRNKFLHEKAEEEYEFTIKRNPLS